MGTVYTTFAGLPVPDANAADDVPAWLSLLGNSLDTKVIQYAVSTSDRDSKLFNAPAGTVCVVVQQTPSIQVIGAYVKLSDVGTTSWDVLWEPAATPVWVDLQLVDGFEKRGAGYEPQVLQEDPRFSTLKGAVVRSDGNNFTNGSTFAYLPPGFSTAHNTDFPCATNTNALGTTSSSTNKVTIGSASGALSWFGPANISWVGLDGIRFISV